MLAMITILILLYLTLNQKHLKQSYISFKEKTPVPVSRNQAERTQRKTFSGLHQWLLVLIFCRTCNSILKHRNCHWFKINYLFLNPFIHASSSILVKPQTKTNPNPWLSKAGEFLARLTSSFNWAKNRGRRCSMVFSLPKMVDSPIITDARADLTCWFVSDTNS